MPVALDPAKPRLDVQEGRGHPPLLLVAVLPSVELVRSLADSGQWGMMAALQCGQIVPVPLSEALREKKQVDPELFASAEVFFG